MAIDYGGNVGVSLGGGLQMSNVMVPEEEFTIILICICNKKQGKLEFLVTKEIYENFLKYKGRMVDVAYREIYQTTYDGKKVVERALVGYDFLNATPK